MRDSRSCHSSCFQIQFQNLYYRFRMMLRRFINHVLNCCRNRLERYLPVQERRYSDFVGGIERYGFRSTRLRRFIGESQARKLVHIRRAEIQTLHVQYVKAQV